MSAASVVIYAGSQLTSTIQEKCNLDRIQWIDVENSTVQPYELKSKNLLFISNKKLLSFLKLRKNRKWMDLLADIAEDEGSATQNDLSRSSIGLQAVHAAVIFVALSPEDLANGEEKFEGIEQLQVSTDHELETRVMERLALMANFAFCQHVITPGTSPLARQGATTPISNQGASARTSGEGATVPTPSEGATAPILNQDATTQFARDEATTSTPISLGAAQRQAPVAYITSQLPSLYGLGQHGDINPQNEDQMNAIIAHNGSTHSSCWAIRNPNFIGNDTMSSYMMAYPLDATRSLSSRGLELGNFQSNQAVPDGHNISIPKSPLQASHPNPYIPITVAELSIGGDEFGHVPHQGDASPSNMMCQGFGVRTDDYHYLSGAFRNIDGGEAPSATGQASKVTRSNLNLNITPGKSLDDNGSTGVSMQELLPSLDSVLIGQGAATHIDSKPTHPGNSETGDRAAEESGESGDDVLVVDLPSKVITYLSSEMDIEPGYGKGWIELAQIKRYVHSRVLRIKGNRRIESPFQFLLSQGEFSGYTYGELKDDLKIIPRLDILKRLDHGTFL